MPTWLNALNCCHAIGWLDICETLNGYMCHLCHVVTNKREKNKNLGLELKMKKDKKWPEQTGHRWRLWHQSKEREWGGVVVQRQASGSGFSHQHQSCNICLLVSLWYCASLSGCSRSLPCSSCSVCMCGFKSVKCIYFSNAASYRVSLDAAVSPVCFQPINSERDSSEGTRDVSHVSKCQSAQPNGAEQWKEGKETNNMPVQRTVMHQCVTDFHLSNMHAAVTPALSGKSC